MVKICRLCATLRKDEQLVTVEDTNHDICQKLRKCCQVEIRIEDVLPKCVCHNCVEALEQAFTFYTKVHESQDSLVVFYPGTTANIDEPDNEASMEKSIPSVLKEQALQLTPSDDSIAKSEICREAKSAFAYKSDAMQIPPTVSKAKRVDPIDLLQVISIIEEDGETTLILEETFGNSEDEEIFNEKHLEVNDQDGIVSDQHSGDPRTRLVTKDEIAEENEDDSVTLASLKSSLKRNIVALLSNNKDEATKHEILEEIDTSTQEEKEIEPVQCSDIGASNETWSSYSWSCHLCDSDESCFWDLKLHCQFIHDISYANMQFKCADCQKVCLRYYNFVNHVRFRHRTALTLCCDVCDTRCADFELLAMHRRIRHATDTEYPSVLLCGECGRGFSNQNALTMHKKAHTEKQRFQCNQCSAQFTRMYNLKAHQKVHSDVKEFSCDNCGKSFRQKVNLEAHMYSHSDDKPYECSICKKSFKTSMNLMKHNEIHSDIKHFKCDHCEKSFRTKDAKLSHERTHTGEMPYSCEYCMRPFRFRSTYLGHLNTHTGNRPYSCLPCDHHFTNWSNYNKHMKRRHAGGNTDQTEKGTSRYNKKSAETYFKYEEDEEEVAEVDDSPATSGVLVEEYSNVLNEDLNEDTFSIIEETSIQEVE